MLIRLWNVTIQDAEKRLWITENILQEFVKNNKLVRIEKCAEVENNINWFHIYDLPFCIHCNNEELARKFYNFLKDLSLKENIQFSY